MSGLRRSTRNATSTINVKLNEQNEIEYFDVVKFEEGDGNNDVESIVDDMDADDDYAEAEYEEDEEEEDEIVEGEEELIVNPDGTMSIKMPEKKPKPKRKVPIHHICAKCSKVHLSHAALKRHLNLCKNLPKDAVTEEKSEFDYSTIDVDDPIYKKICFCCNEDKETAHYGHVSCNFCPKSFKSHVSLERHLYLLHSAEKQYSCVHCNATCPTDKILDIHFESHETGKPFSCSFCGKDFTRKYHLDRHLQYTSCDKSRKKSETACHVCGKLFSRTDNLREHLRAHIGQSTRKRDYQCPHCEKSFYGSSLLNIHIRTHTGEKPFLCDLCNKSFPSNGALRKHRRSHTGEKPYTCKTCGKSFSAKETLNRHNKTHTGERPYSCEYCDKSFIQATQLRSHLFHHTGENGFSCDTCGSKFNRKSRLESHIKQMHMKKDESKKVKEFQCTACEKQYSTKSALLVHQKTHYERELKCHICDKRFKAITSFEKHMESKHADNEKIDESSMITIIKEDQAQPNTYKIVCKEDANYEFTGPVTESYEIITSDAVPDDSVRMADIELKDKIAQLLKTVVDEDVLEKFGYPKTSIEHVLVSVIKQCGQVPVDNSTCQDPSSKLRENVKLLFTSVIDDETIKEMLNNHTIDEVINYVIKLSES